MTRRFGGGEQRRRSVLQSLETQPSGGFTTHAAKIVAAGLGGTEEVCTVTGYLQTSVFEFPGCRLTSERPIAPQTIAKRSGLTAAIVSNLPAYFQKGYASTSHYAIDVSLRAAVERAYRKESAPSPPTPAKMFVVIEQEARVSPTTFERGECFMIDEYRDGQELIEGGREGNERAGGQDGQRCLAELLARRTGTERRPRGCQDRAERHSPNRGTLRLFVFRE